MKGCGTCTLCCTLMRVEMDPRPEPSRPAGKPCQHLCKRGCGVYDDRPKACREFECLWLAAQRRTDVDMPKSLRPDKTGVVLEVNSHGNVIAHCARDDAWHRGEMGRFLRSIASRTTVLVQYGKMDTDDEKVGALQPNGILVPMRYIGTDPESHERKYITGAKP